MGLCAVPLWAVGKLQRQVGLGTRTGERASDLVARAGGVCRRRSLRWRRRTFRLVPAGPGEAYRPWYRCSPRYIDQVNITNIREVSRVHVQNTYVNIVNVTNITYMNRTRRHGDASG